MYMKEWTDIFKLDSIKPTPKSGTSTKTKEEEEKEIQETEVTTVEEEEEENKDKPEAKETKKEKPTEVETPEGEEQEELYTPFIAHLIDKGVLTIDTAKEYEDSEAGFEQVVNDTVEAKLREKIDSLPDDIKRLVELGKDGVNVRHILEMEEQQASLENIDLTDSDNLYNMVIDHLMMAGHEEKDAIELADTYKEAGEETLKKHGKTAHNFLLKKHKEALAEKIEQDKQSKLEVAKQREKQFSDFKNKVLSTEKLGQYALPKEERQKLLDYMTKPVRNGKTQSQLDDNEDSRLLLAYLRMKKFDISSIEKKVKTEQSKSLQEKLGRFKDKGATSSNTNIAPKQKKENEDPTKKVILPKKLYWQ